MFVSYSLELLYHFNKRFRYGVIWCNHQLKPNNIFSMHLEYMCVHMLIIMLIIGKEKKNGVEFTGVGFTI